MQAVTNASYNRIKQEQKTQILPSSIQLNGCDIPLSNSVQNLGVTLEQTFSFQKYVSGTCQAWNSSNHHYFSHDALKILICAFVLSHTDYCNSLLTGCPKILACKLQNIAARLISHSARSDHISLILCALHQLPIKSCNQYKIITLTYKSLSNQASPYLSDIQRYVPSCQLNSSAVWYSIPLSFKFHPLTSSFDWCAFFC